MKNISNKAVILGLTIVSILLIVGGFFCPPMGQIDGSCLTATGELLGWGSLWTIFHSINKGADIKFQHGQTEVSIENDPDAE